MKSLPILAFLLLAASLAAQGPSASPLAGIPLALSVDGATTWNGAPLSATDVLEKGAGFADTAPAVPIVPAGQPDFSPGKLWRNTLWGIPAGPLPDIDAMSVGLDFILSTPGGLMTVPVGDWGAITFSVTRTAVGALDPVLYESGTPLGSAGDLFVYLLPSVILPPGIGDRTYRAQDSTEIDIAAAGAEAEMDAHDLYIPLLRMGPAVIAELPPGLAPVRYFFSVTKATRALVPAAWWGGTLPSGGTILETVWNGATWSLPVPFKTYAALGMGVDDELDAVAVDLVRGHILFSTKNAGPAWDEIMHYSLTLGGPPNLYRASATPGDTVRARLGLLRTDDVDAICALDPGSAQRYHRFLAGNEAQANLPFPSNVTSSLFRAPSFSNDILRSTVIGHPPAGQVPGFGALFFANPLQPFNVVHVGVFGKQPNSFEGWPLTVSIPVPPNPGLWGVELLQYWAVFDQGLATIDVTRPLRFFL